MDRADTSPPDVVNASTIMSPPALIDTPGVNSRCVPLSPLISPVTLMFVANRTTPRLGARKRLPWNPCDSLLVPTQNSPNPWGLYDMAGNADEWTCSVHKYSEYYNGNESICTNDFESSLAIRGGSWESHPVGMRSDLREDSISKSRKNHLGFRLAQDL